MTVEEWKKYDDDYDVSSHGRVRSWKNGRYGRRNKPKVKKLRLGNHGYFVTKINGRKMLIHRLVLLTFKGKPKPGHECLHNDGNPQNNHLENLRWGTRRENSQDTVKHGRSTRGVKHPLNKLTEDNVREIRKRISDGEKGVNIARAYGVNPNAIYHIKQGRTWRWLNE